MTDDLGATIQSWPSAQTTLHWALRTSFTEYVHSIDDGRITTDGVELDEQSRFVFRGVAPVDDADLSYRGSTHFWAHFGVMDFLLSDIRIHLGDRPRITIGAQARQTARATIAELVVPESISGSSVILGATLTQEGVRLLGDVYSVGAALEPVEILRTR